ncbi:unnamed protein product [Urochloa humidicola]
MATNPEEFFLESIMEPIPPSPSVFVDLPQIPVTVGAGGDDLVLPYVSYVLMEDDTDDSILNQYSDHPSLVQVQESFAQIISSNSFGTYNFNSRRMASPGFSQGYKKGTSMDASNFLLQGSSSGDEITSNFDTDVVAAFLKGVEEAKSFLPTNFGTKKDKLVERNFHGSSNSRRQKKRCSREKDLDDEQIGRTNKALMTLTVPYLTGPGEIFDELMLFGYETCKKDMDNLRCSMINTVVKKHRKGYSKVRKDVVDLRALLILCVQAVTVNNQKDAGGLLKQIKQYASTKGDATQRLARCFAEGLEARLAGSCNQVHNSLMVKSPSFVEFLSAYKLYTAASTFNKVSHVFTTTTIMHAIEGKNRLHVVQFGTNFGLEWPCLLRRLANREGGPPKVRITSIVCPQTRSFPIQWHELTGCQIGSCARKYCVEVEFHTITAHLETVCLEDFKTDPREVLVLVDLFNLSNLMDESIFFDRQSPKDTVLSNINKMRPNVFIQSIVNCTSSVSFRTRFREALFYYTAMFDMLDATMPRESEARLVLEQSMFGSSALNIIACEGLDLMDRPENYSQWQVRNQHAGLKQLPLKQSIVQIVTDNIMKLHHKEFLLGQDNEWLIQGWKGRVLFAHSTWVAEGPP